MDKKIGISPDRRSGLLTSISPQELESRSILVVVVWFEVTAEMKELARTRGERGGGEVSAPRWKRELLERSVFISRGG